MILQCQRSQETLDRRQTVASIGGTRVDDRSDPPHVGIVILQDDGVLQTIPFGYSSSFVAGQKLYFCSVRSRQPRDANRALRLLAFERTVHERLRYIVCRDDEVPRILLGRTMVARELALSHVQEMQRGKYTNKHDRR